ncbi:MAG TPA: pentapeptide repeat-containing protein [Blastocatellia bacterium]
MAWRDEDPDLSGADLAGVDLRGADLMRADLRNTNLRFMDLIYADLRNANLAEANLFGAKLANVNLSGAKLNYAFLTNADLTAATLNSASLRFADLSGTTLKNADLTAADLAGARLAQAYDGRDDVGSSQLADMDLTGATLDRTVLAGIDLSFVKGLDRVQHAGPSTIGIDTLYKSKGLIPDAFLKGCGLSDWEIELSRLHRPNLTNRETIDIFYGANHLKATQSVQTGSLFISYNHGDTAFINRLETALDRQGIRFWRDTRDATAGPLEKQVESRNESQRHGSASPLRIVCQQRLGRTRSQPCP